jgi:squalene-associated FAD-dependent desaturase
MSRVAVVGGGLAGLAAAVAAADAGAEVVLLEGRPRLGGATTSFRRGELWVDNGQHVFLRCCTAYRQFLRRLGVEHLTTLQDRLDVPVLLAATEEASRAGAESGHARLRRTRVPWPAPLHLAPALLGYRAMPTRQRLAAALAALRLGRLDSRDPKVDGRTFGGWLAAHGQGPAATEALWELLTVATLNAPASAASLGLAAKVVRTGLLEGAANGDIGWADVPLHRLHAEAASSALESAGAEVRTGAKVTGLRAAGDGWLVETGGAAIEADAVVLAVPAHSVGGLLPAGSVPDPDRFEHLGVSPIVNVHVVFDRPVFDGPFAAVVGSPVQWVFDRTATSGLHDSVPGGQYVAISLSAAESYIDRPVAELRETFVAELRRLFPAARAARVVQVIVTRERAATFRQAPGTQALRPGPHTAWPSLALAGAWTDTGWPATMEGAVRSGNAAAEAVLASVGGGLRRAPGRVAA